MAKPRQYTKEEKIAILKVLERNEFNYSATSRETGVMINTLKNWLEQYHYEVFESPAVVTEEVKFTKFANSVDEAFIVRANNIRHILLDKITEVIPETKELKELINAFKVINDSIHLAKDHNESKEAYTRLFQQINNININAPINNKENG